MTQTPDISVLLPDEDTVRARRGALERLLRTDDPRRRRFRGRRLVVAIAALLVLGGGAAFASGVFSADDIDLEAGVGCADRPSLKHANMTIFRGAADPVAKCTRFWRQGVVKIDDTTPPQLTACSAPSWGIGVFPGGPAVCDRLGLEPLPTDYAPVGMARARAYGAWNSMTGSLRGVIPTGRAAACPSPQKQLELAQGWLSRQPKYAAVEVLIGGDEPCGGGYQLADDHIEVITVSRERARRRWAGPNGGSSRR